MPLNINLLSDDTIARGVTPPDYGKAFEGYQAGQDYAQKQALQNLFAGGLPRDPNDPKLLDYQKIADMLARASGAAAIPTLATLRQGDIQQQALKQNADLGNPFPTLPSEQPRVQFPGSTGRPPGQAPSQYQSSVEPDQGGGGVSKPPGQNAYQESEVPGSARMSVDGGPMTALASEPAPGAPGPYPQQFGNVPATGPPTERFTQVAQAQQRPQPPVNAPARPPIENPADPGYWTLENARAYDRAAYIFNMRAQNLGVGGLAAGVPGPKQQAEQLGARAQQIYDHISKDTALTPEMRNAAASGLATPVQYEEEKARREKGAALFATRYEGINKAGADAAAELPQLQVAKTLMDNPKFMSGVGADVDLTYKRLLAQFGGDPNAAVPQEAFRKLISNSLLENMRTMQGTGPTRVATIKIMQQAAANPENSVAANRLLVEMNARLQQRMLNIADMAQNYRGGQLDAGFDRKLQAYDSKNPLFNEAEVKDPRLIAPPLFRTPQDAMYSGQPRGTPFRIPSGEIRYIP